MYVRLWMEMILVLAYNLNLDGINELGLALLQVGVS